MAINPAFRQQHFVVYEIVLPYCTVCTPRNGLPEAWHTPITCEESSDDEYRLWIASSDAPTVLSQPTPSINIKSKLNSKIFRCVINSSESTSKLKAGEGLASRGTMSITCTDFDGDPGPINFSDKGTFFGKLRARNVLQGKKIITHKYTIAGAVGQEVIEEIGTSTHFITNTELSNGVFKLQAKDALKDVEAFSQKFPEPSEIVLTADINETTTTIPVSEVGDIVAGSVVRIDDELMYVNSTGANVLNVAARGTTITNPDSTVVYKTNVSDHSTDSTVQPSYVMSKTPLWTVLEDIYTSLGLTEYIDVAQWQAEIQEWNADAFLYGVFSKPDEGSSLINRLLSAYLIDMWLDQQTQKIRVSAVTAWKDSIRILEEGNDLSSLVITESEDSRFSRAYMYNKKDFKAENDDVINYSKLTISTDTAVETDDFYGSIKVKEFDNNDFISTASAQTTVARYIQRFSRAPKNIKFKMEERKLAGTAISDIVDIVSRDSQSPDGSVLVARDRAQIIRIQPDFNKIGRQYNVEALSYVPLIASDPNEELVIFLSGSLFDVNLFARAGAPNVPINVTFVLDGCTIGSTQQNVPSVRAGNFQAGSRIKIICTNNTRWSAIGGDGGLAESGYNGFAFNSGFARITRLPTSGGNSYQSDGIETEIYLNYGIVDGYQTSSELYAAGGGGAAGGAVAAIGDNRGTAVSNSIVIGGGGSGIPAGEGGSGSYVEGFTFPIVSSNDGTFESGGSSFFKFGGSVSVSVFTANTEIASSGNGGTSTDGGSVSGLIAIATSLGGGIKYAENKTSPLNGGLAGGAIKGSLVTVYNLASESSKFRQGRSDSFTLIDS